MELGFEAAMALIGLAGAALGSVVTYGISVGRRSQRQDTDGRTIAEACAKVDGLVRAITVIEAKLNNGLLGQVKDLDTKVDDMGGRLNVLDKKVDRLHTRMTLHHVGTPERHHEIMNELEVDE